MVNIVKMIALLIELPLNFIRLIINRVMEVVARITVALGVRNERLQESLRRWVSVPQARTSPLAMVLAWLVFLACIGGFIVLIVLLIQGKL